MHYASFAKLWRQLKLYTLTPKLHTNSSVYPYQTPPAISHLHKKSRKSLDEETPIGVDFTTIEYAVEQKVLEAPVFELSYYADVVGEVPLLPNRTEVSVESIDIGNGDLAPEWGIDMVVHGGFLRYGPWADRQR
jgi:hypothetical protein